MRKGLRAWIVVCAMGAGLFMAGCSDLIDTTPPTLTLTSPQDQTVYFGTVDFAGTAYDENGVAVVQYMVSDGNWETATGTENWSFTHDFGKLENYEKSVVVRAYDTNGNEGNLYITLYFGEVTSNYIVITNIVVITNYYTNEGSTNTNTSGTNELVYLTLKWENVPQMITCSAGWWYPRIGMFISNNGVTNTNAYPAVAGSEPWMHEDNSSTWNITKGNLLSYDYTESNFIVNLIVDNASTNAYVCMGNRMGTSMGYEENYHQFFIPTSGYYTQVFTFDTNSYTPPETNIIYLTLIWENIPSWVTNGGGWWSPMESALYTNLVWYSNADPVLTGSAGWMHTSESEVWNPAYGRLLTKDTNLNRLLISLTITNPDSVTNTFRTTSVLGLSYGSETGNHTLVLPTDGWYTQTFSFYY